jgi:GTP-binding protein HflX
LTSLEKVQENAAGILVGVRTPEQNPDDCMENMKELEQLAITAGVNVKYILKQDRQRIHPSQSIGSGKIIELKEHIDRTGSNLVIFDENLSPAQIKNLESLLNIKIVDRSTIILDIFAKHAKTRESKTQVELAQLQYLLPRLTRQWTHLSRQAGHIGIKGPGETQLETDRRLVRKRIIKLQSDLHDIEKQRAVRRSNRKNYFQVSLVGYTNVGKSTIMNMLSGANLLVENQLFATLDSTIRRVKLNENHQILLSDTVGFIRKLPPHLVASFKSTLEEIRNSDLILHIVDASYPKFEDQMEVVGGILGDLDATKIPVLLIFNKIDLLENLEQLSVLKLERKILYQHLLSYLRKNKNLFTFFIQQRLLKRKII